MQHLCCVISARFCHLAIFDVLSTGKYKFYTGMMLLNESDSLFTDAPLILSKLLGFTFTYRGSVHKLLDVSVDFNPVLFVDSIPDEIKADCSLLPHIKERGDLCDSKTLSENTWNYD